MSEVQAGEDVKPADIMADVRNCSGTGQAPGGKVRPKQKQCPYCGSLYCCMEGKDYDALAELLTDWLIAVEIQRESGNSMIRNGVEWRMLEAAKLLRDVAKVKGEKL